MVNRNMNKVFFNTQRSLKNTPILPDHRLIMELQSIDSNQQSGFIGVGWTWIELADRTTGKLRNGSFTLPIYTGVTKPSVAAGKGKRPPFAPGLAVNVKIGQPGDGIFNMQCFPAMNIDEAPVPREHA